VNGDRPRRGIVQLAGLRCGELVEQETGTLFCYDAAWLARPDARPVSLTLPLRAEPYDAAGFLPFFANLLPEGWLVDLSLARLEIARDDAFGLLLATCRDCMGEVEILAEEP